MRSLLATVLISLIAMHGAAADATLSKVSVFQSGTNDVALYRIPGIVVTPSGTVLAYCEARRSGKADFGEIEVHLRRSTDGGATWQDAKRIAHLGPRIEGNPRNPTEGRRQQTVNNPVAIVDRETGSVEFLYCVNYARCFSIRSIDDGLTWSAPIEITDSFEPFRSQYDWKVIATGPGHGVQMKSGRLVVPVWIAYSDVGAHHPSAAATIYSDDHGKTWHAGEIAVPNEAPYRNPNETMITNLSDGRVMLVTRSVSDAGRKLVTTSDDGATNWNKPVFHDSLWEPICMASIVAIPSSPGTLLFSCPSTLAFDKDGTLKVREHAKRQNLTIKQSRDDGKTWPISKALESGRSAYSDLAVMPDGTVLCLYEAGDQIVCARFSLDWIESSE